MYLSSTFFFEEWQNDFTYCLYVPWLVNKVYGTESSRKTVLKLLPKTSNYKQGTIFIEIKIYIIPVQNK